MEQATKLAKRQYLVEILLDETTDGEPIFLARSPELEGCLAQGETNEQAHENLVAARIDFICSLLEDGLPVPDPTTISTTTTSSAVMTFVLPYKENAAYSKLKHDLSQQSPIYQFA
ncbi:MAG: type II toxin-antitoxin system HicB family antitoxin, partial [Chloroflexi bacterium]|nr:type II toxin-antitoxin system HicB family antitoxin [Chloroflexota bacterium]MBI5349108.1 type II toxin-antitoxin system HicB family antitoxin [Chloroflexota bacterium]